MDMVTREEKEMLEQRLAGLISNRPMISKRIAEARELGDLKENGDYHAAREEQGLQEAEIRRLEQRLASVSVVDEKHKGAGVVFIGATVRIVEVRVDPDSGSVEEVDEVETFRLVGESGAASSADITEATVNSPFGEALLKARLNEIVSVRGPRGIKKFQIKEIV